VRLCRHGRRKPLSYVANWPRLDTGGPSAVSVLLGIKCASGLMLAAMGAWAAVTFGGEASSAFLPAACGLAFGYMVPDRVLTRLARRRSAMLRRGLPAALDLMVLAVEAGQALDASILDTSHGLRMSTPTWPPSSPNCIWSSGPTRPAKMRCEIRTAHTRF